ncbi:MAG: cation:proton antiporter [Planctomycetota bacterium]|nr:cation:proton antiporter [Planctomycetota bacterium]
MGVTDWVTGVFGLLLIAALCQALCKRVKLPFTVMLVLTGVLISQAVEGGLEFLAPLAVLQYAGAEIILFVFLPTLIFESAFNLDVRQLRANLAPILMLAVPGLLISTGLIGVIVHYTTGIPLNYALVLGSILSATDPVAVIALFKQLGAPARLTVLVEGESLFNDATAIVVSKILVGVVVMGTFTGSTALDGSVAFCITFFGGIAVGLVLGGLCGFLLGLVDDDPFIEISLTTIVAYASFVVGEHYLHVSGVMATVAAAVTLGGWGRTKISPSISHLLSEFWEFLAYIANALIFFLVGLRVDLGELNATKGLLVWVIAAMLISRAVVIFGGVPLLRKFAAPVSRRHQAVMYWGGLRGAIALAIALELPAVAKQFSDSATFEYADSFVALVTGAVLFTLLVPGLTIEQLMRRLGLDQPPLSDRFARIDGLLSAETQALKRIPELQRGGMFSPRVADAKVTECNNKITALRNQLDELRSHEMDSEQERRLLFLRAMATEGAFYYQMYKDGHLNETSYRELAHRLTDRMETMRYDGRVSEIASSTNRVQRVIAILTRPLEATPIGPALTASRAARAYQVQWGQQQATGHVLDVFDDLIATETSRTQLLQEVREWYQKWHKSSADLIDSTAAQFPEFVTAMQERLADRLVLNAARQTIGKAAQAGSIPHGVAHHMQSQMGKEVRTLSTAPVSALAVNPRELLLQVPFFQDADEQEVNLILGLLREHTASAGETLIKQGEVGYSLYLIARGVVRVSCQNPDATERDLGTLLAGDFFGEIALLQRERRTATCRAVTPCSVFRLRKVDLDAISDSCPRLMETLMRVSQDRLSSSASSAQPVERDT